MCVEFKYIADINVVTLDARHIKRIEELEECRKMVLDLYKKFKTKKVLVDARNLESAPSSRDIFNFSKGLEGIQIRIAILEGNSFWEESRFLEELTTGKGSTFKSFRSKTEAFNWLDMAFN